MIPTRKTRGCVLIVAGILAIVIVPIAIPTVYSGWLNPQFIFIGIPILIAAFIIIIIGIIMIVKSVNKKSRGIIIFILGLIVTIIGLFFLMDAIVNLYIRLGTGVWVLISVAFIAIGIVLLRVGIALLVKTRKKE